MSKNFINKWRRAFEGEKKLRSNRAKSIERLHPLVRSQRIRVAYYMATSSVWVRLSAELAMAESHESRGGGHWNLVLKLGRPRDDGTRSARDGGRRYPRDR